MVITMFIALIQTIGVYRLACMKKSGNRLFPCPDFVIHYKSFTEVQPGQLPRTWPACAGELVEAGFLRQRPEPAVVGQHYVLTHG